jgi:hypothetical protein
MTLLLPGPDFHRIPGLILQEAETQLTVLVYTEYGGEPFTAFGGTFFYSRGFPGYQEFQVGSGYPSAGNFFPD